MELNRQDRPPRPGPELFIKRLKALESIQFVVISQALWGCMTHWNGQTTEPCYRKTKECPGHKRGLPTRWKGYLHIRDWDSGEEFFLEFTPKSAESLMSQLGSGVLLRGQRMRVERMKGPKARLRVSVLPSYAAFRGAPELPPEKSPLETLRKLWGLPDVVCEPLPTTNLSLEGDVG